MIAKAYNALAIIYKETREFDKSLSFINKSIDLSNKIVDFELDLRNNEILADLYKEKNDFEKSFFIYSKILKAYKKLFDKSDLLGLKQIFREQFSRILDILKILNKLLNTPNFTIQSEILEKVKNNAVDLCKTGTSIEILGDLEKKQLKEEVIKLNHKINELESIIDIKDKGVLEKSIIEEICKNVKSYQGEPITSVKIREFLLKIPDPIIRYNFLVKILSRIPNYYYTMELMYRRLKEIIEKLPFDDEDDIIFCVLSETWNKSQNFWTYVSERSISRYNKTEIMKTPQLTRFLLKENRNKNFYVLFLDDVIGSGRQFIKYYKKDFEARLKKYPIVDKENIHFYLIVGIISKDALVDISKKSIFKLDSIKYDKIIKNNDKAFYEKNWENIEALSNLKHFLLKNDPKCWDGWKKEPDKERGMEYLVILEWRVPNNTIGILWNKSKYTIPLFPR